jgi:DNA polymerase-3 subunit gamma/tau
VPAAVAVVVRPPVVQPWEEAPALPEPAVAVAQDPAEIPPGQVLTVRDSGPEEDEEPADLYEDQNRAPAHVATAPAATKVVAVPVRTQAEGRSDAVAALAPPVLLPTEEGDFWHATVQQLIQAEAITALVRQLALQSQLVARDTDQWLLRVESESLNQPGTRDRLTAALAAAGFAVKLVVEVGRVTDSPSRRNAAASAEKQLAAEKIISDHPFVQSMVRDFGAKIVPGSIRPL